MTVSVGVIGLHFGAQVHVPAFRRDSRCLVAALAGRDPVRTRSAADTLGIPVAHADWRALLADDSIDAVSIAVPPAEQAPIIVEAARAGKHLFCEKPLAAGIDEAERAVECARRAGVVHAIDFLFPEIPAWQLARTLIGDGAIGKPRHFSYSWKVQTFASRTRADSWKTRLDDGGGAAGNFVSHIIFNIGWLLASVTALDVLQRRDPCASRWFCECVAYLQSGVHGLISVSTDAYFGGGHQVEIWGDRGTLVLSNSTADYASGFEVSVATFESGRLDVVGRDESSVDVDGRIVPVGRIARRFIDAIEDRSTSITPNLDDGLHVQHCLDQIRHAFLR
jgi:predicted dehydrogenase